MLTGNYLLKSNQWRFTFKILYFDFVIAKRGNQCSVFAELLVTYSITNGIQQS